MTYYIYKKPTGFGFVYDKPEPNVFMSEYEFLYSTEEQPDIEGKMWDGTAWVDGPRTPQYVKDRQMNYPKVGDQLDMLWHAMDDGVLTKVEPFYTQIKSIKEQYPKA